MNQKQADKGQRISREVRRLYADAGFIPGLYTRVRLKLAPIIQMEQYVPGAGTVLDLGCGSGIFASILLLGSDQRKVQAVDINPRRIRTARRVARGNPNLEFAEGDAGSYPLKQCAAVTLIDLLHHMEFGEQDQLLRKLYAGVSEGAVVLIKDLEKAPWWKYAFHYVQDSLSYRSRLYFRSASDMQFNLRNIGFEVETISLAAGYMHPHILYRCRKGSGKPMALQRGN